MKKALFIFCMVIIVMLTAGMTVYYENGFLVGIAGNEWGEGPIDLAPGRISDSGVVYLGTDPLPTADGTYDDWYVGHGTTGNYFIRSPYTVSGGVVTVDYTNDDVFPVAFPMNQNGVYVSYFAYESYGKIWNLLICSDEGNAINAPFYVSFIRLND